MDTKNLLELLNKYKIEIPEMQRDYVQGRQSAKNVRDAFLYSLYDFLNSDRDNYNLDFIYGYIENTIFYPVDGQQRLTTLWLLHLYIYGQLENFDYQDTLSNFSYSVRDISAESCEYLVDKMQKYTDIPSNIIKNRVFFNDNAFLDPTVLAIVNMLDSIHEKFKDIDLAKAINQLNKIKFTMIRMEDVGLGESLYIKMNGRGKQLSAFENFKAWVMQDKTTRKEFTKNKYFDNDWIDVFWKIIDKSKRDEVDKEYDKHIMTYTHYCGLYFLLKNGRDRKYSEFKDKNIDNLDKSFYRSNNNDDVGVFKYDNLIHMTNTLSLLKDNLDYLNYDDVDSVIKLFAFITFVENDNYDNDKLQEWISFINRTIDNTRSNTDDDKMKSAFNFLQKYREHSSNIIEYLSDREKEDKNEFASAMIREEIIKAKLIINSRKNNDNWEESIKKAHKNKYLNGKIYFLLLHSKNGNDSYDLEQFNKHYEIINKICVSDFWDNKDKFNLFRQTLLSYSSIDYPIYKSHSDYVGYKYNLLSNNSNNSTDLQYKLEWHNHIFEQENFNNFITGLENIKADSIEQVLKEFKSKNIKNNYWDFEKEPEEKPNDYFFYILSCYDGILNVYSQRYNVVSFNDNNKVGYILNGKIPATENLYNLLTYGFYMYLKNENIEVGDYTPESKVMDDKIRFIINHNNKDFNVYSNRNENKIKINNIDYEYSFDKSPEKFYSDIVKKEMG